MSNKLFAGGTIPKSTQVSMVRTNREYMINNDISEELNTYKNFGVFKTFNDIYDRKFDSNGNEKLDEETGPGTPGVRSIFNKMGAVMVGSSTGNLDINDVYNASEWRISNNVPLLDTPNNRKRIKTNSGCTIKELVEASRAGVLGRAIYDYSDFMYCKYLGKVPNNYLITLRRFPIPVGDFISSVGEGKTRTEKGIKSNFSQQIGCLVTWMGTPGNEMQNLLKYSYNMAFKEHTAEFQDVTDIDADKQKGVLNSIAAAFDPSYRRMYSAGYGGDAINPYINSFFKKFSATQGISVSSGYDAHTATSQYDQNKVYGPVDRVKSTYMRSDEGLTFLQTFNITFDYELRAYNGINPRQAMLDLISNILKVTYTTGDFWGGGYKGVGMGQNSIFANLNIFKAHGGFTDFIDAFAQDYSNATESFRTQLGDDWLKNIGNILKSAMNQIGGMLIAGALNTLGRPAKFFGNSLLSEQPVGLWHLTIGNPHNPILSVGNLILKRTTVEHYGPLGLDDFPTGIRITCELERGKPRDLREIEKMYMKGNDRIYAGMGPKVFDMYKAAEEYKGDKKTNSGTSKDGSGEIVGGSDDNSNIPIEVQEQINMSESDLKKMGSTLKKYFGETDSYSIYVASGEQEYGAFKKKEKINDNK